MQIDSYDSPDAQDLLRAGEERIARNAHTRRELITNAVGAVGFVTAAAILAAAAPWHRSFSVVNLILVAVVWIAIERVRFPVAGAWTYPTVLVFIPALFMLPTPTVPLVAMFAVVLRAAPELWERRISLSMVPTFVTDAWFSLGPVLVIVLAGAQRFDWAKWPVYALALFAQIVFDAVAAIGWSWVGEGTNPRVQMPLLGWGYVVDVALAPLGFVIAAAAVQRPALLLIALSPTVMLLALARERKQRLGQTVALSTAYRGTALLLGDVVEADDEYTGLHSRDVVDHAIGVAAVLGLDAVQQRNVEFAALLHDVGKIRVPNEIINKPGQLDDDEWQIIRQHTIEGEKMLKQVGGILSSIGRFVRSSHERWDGAGYPDGLAGEQIPIESRIVAACDAFSAMTTDRSYRPALALQDALAELRRCAGSQFAPQVVAALDQIVSARISRRRELVGAAA